MKKWLFVIVVLVGFANSACDTSPVEGESHVCVPDTIVKVIDVYVVDNIKIDSLELVIDSLQEQLFIVNYKIERIRYYNNVAKNGNNIKYLRGWINRVLNE